MNFPLLHPKRETIDNWRKYYIKQQEFIKTLRIVIIAQVVILPIPIVLVCLGQINRQWDNTRSCPIPLGNWAFVSGLVSILGDVIISMLVVAGIYIKKLKMAECISILLLQTFFSIWGIYALVICWNSIAIDNCTVGPQRSLFVLVNIVVILQIVGMGIGAIRLKYIAYILH